MKKPFMMNTVVVTVALVIAAPLGAHATGTVFDDFNVNLGHFNLEPGYSGSTTGIDPKGGPTSTVGLVTTAPKEGGGCEQIVLYSDGSPSAFVRLLSGVGSPANNISFTTSTNVDGWIGCYVKTTNAGWQVQIWIEQTTAGNNNAGVPKDIIADNEWHLYEWDLDNTAGDADGWQDILGLGGGPVVADTNHTIDSIIFRNSAVANATNVFFLDFVARNDSGSVADLLNEPCRATSGVVMKGPISTNSNQVVVAGVTNAATRVTVYQNTGAGMVAIGSKTSGITDGDNVVTVSGLVKTAKVAGTQTVAGQESCIPETGVVVGGGNSRIRLAYSIKETSGTGPVGEPGVMGSDNMHFLGATNVLSGYAPEGGPVLTPSTNWQTVTLKRGLESIGDSANVVGTLLNSKGYAGNDTVRIQVYAYRTLHGVRIYSVNPVESSLVTSNHAFAVNWAWNAVAGAQGYRLLRDKNGAYYTESVDVAGNSYTDADSSAWTSDVTVTPNTTQTDSSIQWYPDSNINPDAIPGDWGILESIAFAIEDLTDTGPYDLYIDNLQNGTTVFQTFEGAEAGATDYTFRGVGYSGTTSGFLLMPPEIGEVSDAAADTGTKSFHIQFQWKGTNATSWLRLPTYFPEGSPIPGGNPMVNLNDPISIRFLLLPPGTSLAPPLSSVTVSNITATAIHYGGGGGSRFVLLESSDVKALRSTWTRAQTNTATPGSFTITPSGAQKFYSIKSE